MPIILTLHVYVSKDVRVIGYIWKAKGFVIKGVEEIELFRTFHQGLVG
jgi:hypothetical protein